MEREAPSLEMPAAKRSRMSSDSRGSLESCYGVEVISRHERLDGSLELVGPTGLSLQERRYARCKAVVVEEPNESCEAGGSAREEVVENRSVTTNALQVHDVGMGNPGAADSQDLLAEFERLLAKKSQEVVQCRGSTSSLAGMMDTGRLTVGKILADVMARERKQLPLFNEEDISCHLKYIFHSNDH